jgi:hypothetical protein
MERFLGTWKLERWTSGKEEPFGPRPQGTLVYTADGTMISSFMRRDRSPIGSGLAAWRRYAMGLEVPKPADAHEVEQRFAAGAIVFNSYSGKYTVEGTEVHHDVEIAMFPDWIGQRLTRTYRFYEDLLSLSFGNDELVWRRKPR